MSDPEFSKRMFGKFGITHGLAYSAILLIKNSITTALATITQIAMAGLTVKRETLAVPRVIVRSVTAFGCICILFSLWVF